ncbi:MAG TPA: hypothetical protein VNJ28_05500 [Candidatus Limnocylindrales bacterium]|nr:hypothetical protein [Candidatus Limnocylindrales bacterium]
MRKIVISALVALSVLVSSATVALAHEGGHQGGCAAFGHLNRVIGQDPASFGFAWARNLGDIVSWFATNPAAPGADVPGVGDIVETFDHAACG